MENSINEVDQIAPRVKQITENKSNRRLLVVFFAILFLLLLGLLIIILSRNQMTDNAKTSDTILNEAEDSVESDTDTETEVIIDDTINDSDTSNISTGGTYTYGSFSFDYPAGWKVTDSTNNQTFFSEYSVFLGERSILLEKENQLLIIKIDPYDENAKIAGVLRDEERMAEYREAKDDVMINNVQFYFSQRHGTLASVNDKENNHTGLVGYISLSELTYKAYPNDSQGTTMRYGYDELIKNKGGKDFIVLKLTTDNSTSSTTELQGEMIAILESITW